jgi:hypothetical protein
MVYQHRNARTAASAALAGTVRTKQAVAIEAFYDGVVATVRLYMFSQFADWVRNKSRHVLNRSANEILTVILEHSKERILELAPGAELFRAQIAHVDDSAEPEPNQRYLFTKPAPVERMIPFRDRAKEGRANSKGIPVLYCGTTRNTALAEVRPWIGAKVTIARLAVRKSLKLVDFSQPSRYRTLSSIRTQDDALDDLWCRINDAYAHPVTDSDNTADYAPTQFLADAFRHARLDGITYRSTVGDGANIALFDIDAAEITDRELHEVQRMTLTSRELTTYKQFTSI